MAHQDFEKYAIQRPMNGVVAGLYDSFFRNMVLPYINKDSRILDFGCGDGKYYDYFKQFIENDKIHGVEISQIRVSRCHSLGWEKVLKVDPLQPLPFPDSFFDVINFDQVIEHISRSDIEFYLKELKRVLARGGAIVLMTPNYPVKRFYDAYNALRLLDFQRLKDDPTHVSKYGFRTLHALLQQHFTTVTLSHTGGILWDIFQHNIFSHKIIGLLKN
jgi:SAM-dependent methyltransferase